MNDELKECPFCGDIVGIMKGEFKITTWIIECTNCGLRMYDNSKKKIKETWNTRHGKPESK